MHSYWFDDGYADHIRNYLWAMGAIPEFAPKAENHILRSTSVITSVTYQAKSIEYSAFDSDSIETLRTTFKLSSVMADGHALSANTNTGQNGYTIKGLDGGDFVLRVHHTHAHSIVIL